MKAKIIDLFCRTIFIFALAYALSFLFQSEPKPIKLESDVRWCFYAEYPSIKDYRHATSPAKAFVNFNRDGGVTIFAPCDDL